MRRYVSVSDSEKERLLGHLLIYRPLTDAMEVSQCKPGDTGRMSAVEATLRWFLGTHDDVSRVKKKFKKVIARREKETQRLRKSMHRMEARMRRMSLSKSQQRQLRPKILQDAKKTSQVLAELKGAVFRAKGVSALKGPRTQRSPEYSTPSREFSRNSEVSKSPGISGIPEISAQSISGVQGPGTQNVQEVSEPGGRIRRGAETKGPHGILGSEPRSEFKESPGIIVRIYEEKLERANERTRELKGRSMKLETQHLREIEILKREALEREEENLKAQSILKSEVLTVKLRAADKQKKLRQKVESLKEEKERDKQRFSRAIEKIHTSNENLKRDLKTKLRTVLEDKKTVKKQLVAQKWRLLMARKLEALRDKHIKQEKSRYNDLSKAYKASDNRCTRLQAKVERLEVACLESQEEKEMAIQDLNNTKNNDKAERSRVAELKSELEVAKLQLEEQYKRNGPLRQQLRDSETGKIFLEQQLDQAISDLKDRESRISSLETTLNEYETRLSPTAGGENKRSEDLAAQIAELIGEKTQANSKLRTVEAAYQTAIHQLEALRKKIAEMEREKESNGIRLGQPETLEHSEDIRTLNNGRNHPNNMQTMDTTAEMKWREKAATMQTRHEEEIELIEDKHSREIGILQEKIIEFESYLNKGYGGNLVALEKELARTKITVANLRSEKDEYEEMIESLHGQLLEQRERLTRESKENRKGGSKGSTLSWILNM